MSSVVLERECRICACASFTSARPSSARWHERSARLDDDGKSQFRELLFHRGEPCYVAFDLLWLSMAETYATYH